MRDDRHQFSNIWVTERDVVLQRTDNVHYRVIQAHSTARGIFKNKFHILSATTEYIQGKWFFPTPKMYVINKKARSHFLPQSWRVFRDSYSTIQFCINNSKIIATWRRKEPKTRSHL